MNKSSMNNPSPATDHDGKKDAIVDQAKQAVTHVVGNVAGQAREQANQQFDTRKDDAVKTMGNVASAIRDTSDKLNGVGPLGDVAGRAADGIESVAEFFEGKHINDVVRDVERFARREPALFLGAAFAIGLIGGRFLKSSAHRQSAGGMGGQGTYARPAGYGYDREGYASSFGSEYDDDFLPQDDLEDYVDSQRFGAYGTQRTGRTTQPMGSRMQATSTTRSVSPAATGATGASSATPNGVTKSGGNSTGNV
jgi:hypothetical protein